MSSSNERKIAEGAISILKHPNTFCKGDWFKGEVKGKNGGGIEYVKAVATNPTDRGQFELTQQYFRNHPELGSLQNPNFQVCGQGAIMLSAILQDLPFEDAHSVLRQTESGLREDPVHKLKFGSIPNFNDSPSGGRHKVRQLLEKGFEVAGLKEKK